MIPTTDFSIRSLLGGYDNNFTYVSTCSRSGAQVIIDAAVDVSIVTPHIHNQPWALLITHSHGDHIANIDQYIETFPKMIILGHPDTLENPGGKNFKSLEHNQSFKIGEMPWMAIHTPGHYYDSICYQMENVLFTGDTLFVGRTGRVISAKSDVADLYDSVYNKLLILPENTRIYPGHDYGDVPTITIDKNIEISPLLQATSLKDFKQKMNDYERNRKSGI